MWSFGRSAQSRPSALLARPPLKLLTRELLGRKWKCKRPNSPHFHGNIYFSPSGCVRYEHSPFRVGTFPHTSSQRKLVNGVFSKESENGPGRRARFVYGRNINLISEHVPPADALQARTVVASRACKVDWPRKSIPESNFLYRPGESLRRCPVWSVLKTGAFGIPHTQRPPVPSTQQGITTKPPRPVRAKPRPEGDTTRAALGRHTFWNGCFWNGPCGARGSTEMRVRVGVVHTGLDKRFHSPANVCVSVTR